MATLVLVISGCAVAPPPEPLPQPVAAPPPPVVPERLPSILFAENSVELTPLQRQQVRDQVAILKQSHVVGLPIRVEGHSDRLGHRAIKEKVSVSRARTIANELIFNGISPERISVIGYGDSQPAAPNTQPDGSDNPEGRALSRRVEVVIQSTADE